jgi:hypothetical protein
MNCALGLRVGMTVPIATTLGRTKSTVSGSSAAFDANGQSNNMLQIALLYLDS